VLLPAPDLPEIETTSAGLTERLTPFNTFNEPKLRCRFSAFKMGCSVIARVNVKVELYKPTLRILILQWELAMLQL
jgi:hypothetical protein